MQLMFGRGGDHGTVVLHLQIERGRLHGTVDLGPSVITHNRKRRHIDVDTGDLICHLKVLLTGSINVISVWCDNSLSYVLSMLTQVTEVRRIIGIFSYLLSP